MSQSPNFPSGPSSNEGTAKATEGPPNLTNLAPELLRMIAEYLQGKDLIASRQTCTKVNAGFLEQFQLRCFGRMEFGMPDQQNLQCLVDVAEYPALAWRVQHVVFRTDVDLIKAWDTEEASGLAGHDRALLAMAFSKLPSLNCIECITLNHQKDEPRPLVTDLDVRDIGDKLMNHYFSVTLAAIRDSGIPPHSIELHLDSESWGLHDIAFRTPRGLLPSLAPVLSRLKTLTLAVDTHTHLADAPHLWRFLSVATGLNGLHLRLKGEIQYLLDTTSFFWRLCLPPPSELHPVHFSALESLSIGSSFIVRSTDMLRLITKVKSTLRSLALYGCTLLDEDNELSDQVDIWAPFLRDLAEETDLRFFRLYGAWILSPTARFRVRAVFKQPRQYGESVADRLVTLEPVLYEGEDVSPSIAALAEMVCIDWR